MLGLEIDKHGSFYLGLLTGFWMWGASVSCCLFPLLRDFVVAFFIDRLGRSLAFVD